MGGDQKWGMGGSGFETEGPEENKGIQTEGRAAMARGGGARFIADGGGEIYGTALGVRLKQGPSWWSGGGPGLVVTQPGKVHERK